MSLGLPHSLLKYLEYCPSKWPTRKSFEQRIEQLPSSLKNRLFHCFNMVCPRGTETSKLANLLLEEEDCVTLATNCPSIPIPESSWLRYQYSFKENNGELILVID